MFSRWIYMVFAAAAQQLSVYDRVCRGGKWTTANKLLWKRMKKTWNGISSKQAALLVISAHIFHVFYYFFESFTACLFFLRARWISSVCCWMSPLLLWVTCKHEMSWVCRTHSRSPASEFVALKSNVGHLRVCRISLFLQPEPGDLASSKKFSEKKTQPSRVSAWKKENFHFYSSINEKKSWRWNV